jgi:hypothetical protein
VGAAHVALAHDWRGTWTQGVESGRRWGVVYGEHAEEGAQLMLVAHLSRTAANAQRRVRLWPRGAALPAGGLTLMGTAAPHDALQAAALTPGGRDVGARVARRGGAAAPRLPRGKCAACGAVRAGLKQCVDCGLTASCSKEARAGCVCVRVGVRAGRPPAGVG